MSILYTATVCIEPNSNYAAKKIQIGQTKMTITKLTRIKKSFVARFSSLTLRSKLSPRLGLPSSSHPEMNKATKISNVYFKFSVCSTNLRPITNRTTTPLSSSFDKASTVKEKKILDVSDAPARPEF